MPGIKIDQIVQVSDEDKDNGYLAENLLQEGEFKKWKSTKWQQTNYIIVKFDQSSRIDTVEIGNECSAFIEIFVCKSSEEEQKFQILLSASSFMTPSESKSLQNTNRVRLFTSNKLSPTGVKDKWDLVKIVCTQPFNKSIPYGLSFIKFCSPDQMDDEEEEEPVSSSLNIGPFKMRNNYDKNDVMITRGALFAKRNNNDDNTSKHSLSLSAAVGLTPQKPKPRQVQKVHAKDSSTEDEPKNKISKIVHNKDSKKDTNTHSPSSSKHDPVPSSSRHDPIPGTSTSHSNKTNKKKKVVKNKDVPFNSIMSKVIFVLSGYVNPKRRELRDKAVEMGARYKQDWDPQTCTHLICAFVNTPKYDEAIKSIKRNNSGRIVTDKWITDCYSKKKLLPWRQYKLGSYKSPPPTDDEDEDEDEDENENENENENEKVEEPENKQNNKSLNQTINEDDDNDDIYDADTDNEQTDDINSNNSNNSLPQLSSIFKDKLFNLYGSFDESEKRTLKRYIIGFGGELDDKLSSNIDIIITNCDKLDDELKQLKHVNTSLCIVNPKWVHDCADKSQFVHINNYSIKF